MSRGSGPELSNQMHAGESDCMRGQAGAVGNGGRCWLGGWLTPAARGRQVCRPKRYSFVFVSLLGSTAGTNAHSSGSAFCSASRSSASAAGSRSCRPAHVSEVRR